MCLCTSNGLFHAHAPRCPMCTPRSARNPTFSAVKINLQPYGLGGCPLPHQTEQSGRRLSTLASQIARPVVHEPAPPLNRSVRRYAAPSSRTGTSPLMMAWSIRAFSRLVSRSISEGRGSRVQLASTVSARRVVHLDGAADLLVVAPQEARPLRPGEDAAVETGQVDPPCPPTRPPEGFQHLLAPLQMSNHLPASRTHALLARKTMIGAALRAGTPPCAARTG